MNVACSAWRAPFCICVDIHCHEQLEDGWWDVPRWSSATHALTSLGIVVLRRREAGVSHCAWIIKTFAFLQGQRPISRQGRSRGGGLCFEVRAFVCACCTDESVGLRLVEDGGGRAGALRWCWGVEWNGCGDCKRGSSSCWRGWYSTDWWWWVESNTM